MARSDSERPQLPTVAGEAACIAAQRWADRHLIGHGGEDAVLDRAVLRLKEQSVELLAQLRAGVPPASLFR